MKFHLNDYEVKVVMCILCEWTELDHKDLSHSDIATTLNIYSHMFKSELQDIATELSEL